MALTICLKCDNAYLETKDRCSYCNHTLNQQILFAKYIPKFTRLKAFIGVVKDWTKS